ncbi:NO signaling/Golgi transport ligand-binding domain-containing protein [Phakopsora pachyrhizi]|nr:NO signaling/Golgi transport ligand-binding domain-containing protein [Phakopsora pachyrhizi]
MKPQQQSNNTFEPSTTQSEQKTRAISIYSRPISSNSSSSINLSSSSSLISSATAISSNNSHQLLSQSEIIRYTQQRVDGISEFEKKDSLNGSVNALKSLSTIKSSNSNFGGGIRLTRLVPVLSWIHTTLWKTIVGKTADILEHSNENEDEYMISDNDLLITRSINVPKEMNQLSCGAYMAGIPARVTSHFAPSTQFPKRTTLLIKFEKNSIDRENSFKTPTNS